jgi:signal peptidase I
VLTPAAPDPTATGFERIRYWVGDQPVPTLIVLFTVFEMALYHWRHELPLAQKLGMGGRQDLPKEARRDFDHAMHLLDEAERILKKNEKAVQRHVPSSARQELERALDALRSSLEKHPFDADDFESAYEKANQRVSRHLGRWRKGELREYAESIGIAIAVALLLRAFVVEAFKIPSGSMLPTLQIQDHIFVNKFAYGPTVPFTKQRLFNRLPPRYGDVMVFSSRIEPANPRGRTSSSA